MKDNIEPGSTNVANPDRIGETDASISFKHYQAVYHQITGRTEQIAKRYSQNLLIESSEIEQLHHKVMQLCDIYTIAARNEVVTVFHEKERKDQFSSFERFRIYNSNTSSPTASLLLRYNFAIIPSGLNKPQEYVVTIRLNSRVAMLKQIEADAPPFMRGHMLQFLIGHTAEITVDYADYVIARSFLEAFDEWILGCKAEPDYTWLAFSRRWSHNAPRLMRLSAALAIVLYALHGVPRFFAAPGDPETWARFFVIYGGGFYMITSLAYVAGQIIENAIDSLTPISYLSINKGDKNLIEDFKRRKRRVILRFALGCILTLVLGVLSSWLAALI